MKNESEEKKVKAKELISALCLKVTKQADWIRYQDAELEDLRRIVKGGLE